MPSHCFSRHFSISTIDSAFDSIETDKASLLSSSGADVWPRFDNLRAVVRKLRGYCHRLRHLELEINELDSEYAATPAEYMDPHLRMAAVDSYREIASSIKAGVLHLKSKYQDETTKEEMRAVVEVGEMLEQVEDRTEKLVDRLERKRKEMQWDEAEQEREYLRSTMSSAERRWHRPPDDRTLSSVHQFFVNIDAQTVYLNDLVPPPDRDAGASHTHAQTNKEHFYNLVLDRLEDVSRAEMVLKPNRKGKEVLGYLRRESVYEAFFGERDHHGKTLQPACVMPTTATTAAASALSTTSCAETAADILTGTTIVNTESCADDDAQSVVYGKRKRIKEAIKWVLNRHSTSTVVAIPGTADKLSNDSDNGDNYESCLPVNKQSMIEPSNTYKDDIKDRTMPETSKIYYVFGQPTGPSGQLAMSAVTNTPVPVPRRRQSRLKKRYSGGQVQGQRPKVEVVTEGVVVHGLA